MRPSQPRFGGTFVVPCARAFALSVSNTRSNAAAYFIRRLISKRCKSCQTLYQSRMKTVFAAALCAVLFLASTFAKGRHCTLRIHAEANANDGTVFSTTIRSQFSGKNVVIEKTPSLSELDVAAFRPYPAPDGSYGVLLQLDDHGKMALDALSIERR